MRKLMIGVVFGLAAFALLAGGYSAQAQGRPIVQVWADGEVFDSVVTPANFDPANGNFDELYSCNPMGTSGFEDGVPLISDSKPGDQDYNGGRWHLNVAANQAECEADYSDATEVGDLDLGDFVSTPVYFECPLLPRRGAGQ